jgi:hypothetical protein
MMSRPLAIVVSVAEAERTCFIAIPFASEFDQLASFIVQAANSLSLNSVFTKQIQKSDDFAQDVARRIRSAHVVVAVCTPERESCKANPNVMYELGIAHSLGKPTVILTTDPGSLPADIRTKYALPYSSEDLNDGPGLILKIKDAISTRITPMTNPLTDPTVEDISVAPARHRILFLPQFWDDFSAILSFARQVHKQLQPIDSVHADALVKKIEEIIYTQGPKRAKISGFNDKWRDYNMLYTLYTKPDFFDVLEADLVRIEDCFNRLPMEADERIKESIVASRTCYDHLKLWLLKYPTLHDAVDKTTGASLLSNLNNPIISTQIYGHVLDLAKTVKDCVRESSELVHHLIGMMLDRSL